MIDKAKLVSTTPQDTDAAHINARKRSKDTTGIFDRHYSYCRQYQINNSKIVLKTNPKLSSISPLSIELNPSHFSGLNEMIDTISIMAPPETLKFSRLDYSSDLPVRFVDIWKMVDVKYKVLRDRYRGASATGLYFGANNHLINIYDKSLKSSLSHPITRFEIREKHRSLTITTLSQLENLLDYNPFKPLRIMTIKEPANYGSPSSYEKLKASIDLEGLSVARRCLGEQNNFAKTYEKYLEPSPFMMQLNENHLSEVSKFLRS